MNEAETGTTQDRYRDDYNHKPYKKRESFLGELFDF